MKLFNLCFYLCYRASKQTGRPSWKHSIGNGNPWITYLYFSCIIAFHWLFLLSLITFLFQIKSIKILNFKYSDNKRIDAMITLIIFSVLSHLYYRKKYFKVFIKYHRLYKGRTLKVLGLGFIIVIFPVILIAILRTKW